MSQSRQILRYHVPNKFLSPKKIYSSSATFVLFAQRRKKIVIRLSSNVSKQTARERNPGCCKHKQNKV